MWNFKIKKTNSKIDIKFWNLESPLSHINEVYLHDVLKFLK